MKIIAFGGSTSKNSINQQLAEYAAQQLQAEETQALKLADFELPLYSVDLEAEKGIPEAAKAFYTELKSADLIVLSLAEHNGSYSTAFKNMFDWLSRYESKTFEDMNMLLMATSPGGRGGLGVLESALDRFPRHGAHVVGHFSLPFFQQNFDAEQGITNAELKAEFEQVLANVQAELKA